MEISEKVLGEICSVVGSENVRLDELMALHLTMQVGGRAKYYITVPGIDELCGLMKIIDREKYPYYVLGNGSNVIIRDEGYDGIIIAMEEGFRSIDIHDNFIIAGAGAMLKDVSYAALSAGLSGLEFACGIPGSAGGGAGMNAGAYGGEMKDVIKEVKAVTQNGQVRSYSNWEMRFGYRHSICSDLPIIICEVVFELSRASYDEIKAKIDDFNARRSEKQPLEYPSCGSTFKRPEGYFAGKLIMDSGLKGYTIGGAQVSEKHCGFVINKGWATARDVLELIDYIKRTVYEKQGVKLECEVKIL